MIEIYFFQKRAAEKMDCIDHRIVSLVWTRFRVDADNYCYFPYRYMPSHHNLSWNFGVKNCEICLVHYNIHYYCFQFHVQNDSDRLNGHRVDHLSVNSLLVYRLFPIYLDYLHAVVLYEMRTCFLGAFLLSDVPPQLLFLHSLDSLQCRQLWGF